MKRARHGLVAAFLVLSLLGVAGTQVVWAASTTYGTLRGKVVDEQDSPMPGVTVIMRSDALVREQAVVTDANGNYFVPGLAPGDYTVVAQLTGFATVQRQTTVQLDKLTVLDFKLIEGELREAVVVTAERPVVSKTETESTYNLRKDFTETIPVVRGYQSLLQFAPGVANTAEESGNPNILGGTRNSNTFLLDGVSITDTVTGTFGSNVNYDTIEEVDVKLTGVSAEYGQFQGGVANVITKSGGNDFTGSIRDMITSPSFEERFGADTLNEFADADFNNDGEVNDDDIPGRGQRELNHDIETTIGGPIVRNHAWFFLSYNRNDSVTIQQLANPTGGPLGDGTYADPFEGDNSLGKLTWQVANNHKLQYNYFEDPALSPRCYGQIFFGGPCYDTPFVDNQFQGGHAWTGSWTGIWTNTFFTDLRISHWENGFGLSSFAPPTIRPELIFESPSGELGAGLDAGHAPLIDLTTGVLFDASFFGGPPEERERDQYELKTTAFFDSESLGSHTLKIGLDYQESTRVGASTLAGNGLIYTLGWVEPPPGLGGNGDPYDINNRLYYFFLDFAEPSQAAPVSKETAIYVQDDWVLNNRWSFNLGLRFEKFEEENDVGEGIIDQTDFAPRLGATFDVKGDGKHLLKATAARYLAGVSLTTLSPFVRGAGGQSAYDTYVNANTDIDGNPLPGEPDWFLIGSVRPDPDTSLFSADLEPQQINELTLGYEFAISPLWGMKFRLVDRDWDNIIGQSFTYDYSTGVPRQILLLSNNDDIDRKYRAAILEVEKRFSNNWIFRGNVIKAKAEGNTTLDTGFSTYGSFQGVPQVTENLYGRLAFDVDAAAKLFGSYRIPLKSNRHILELGGSFDWSAGNRYAANNLVNVVVGPGPDGAQDVPLGTSAGDVPAGIDDQTAQVTEFFEPRGSRQEPDLKYFDFLARYQFKLARDVIFESRFRVDNLTDEQRPFEVNAQFVEGGTNESFGRPVGYGQLQNPRSYELNFGLIW